MAPPARRCGFYRRSDTARLSHGQSRFLPGRGSRGSHSTRRDLGEPALQHRSQRLLIDAIGNVSMNGLQTLWRMPTDVELWLILAYVTGVLIAARVIEALAKVHYARGRRHAEHGFEYVAPRDEYHCLGGATLKLDAIHESESMAIYRAPVEHCGGCHLKAKCAPLEQSRRIDRSLATWAETDVGRFHHYVSVVLFAAAGVLSLAGLWQLRRQPGIGYLALALTGSLACLVLQSWRLKTNQGVHSLPTPPSQSS